MYKERKGHQVEGNQQRIIFFFFFSKINLFKERNKEFVALLTKEKWLRMSGKMMTPTFFELRAMHTQFMHTGGEVLIFKIWTKRGVHEKIAQK